MRFNMKCWCVNVNDAWCDINISNEWKVVFLSIPRKKNSILHYCIVRVKEIIKDQ